MQVNGRRPQQWVRRKPSRLSGWRHFSFHGPLRVTLPQTLQQPQPKGSVLHLSCAAAQTELWS